MLPLTSFYVHPAMGDGRLNKCKECTKADVRANYAANTEHYQAYDRERAMKPHRVRARAEYQSTPEGRAAVRRAHQRYIADNPEKRAAHIVVGNALRDGRLHKRPCEACGAKRVHAHHDDYSQPLKVRWLCPRHHVDKHKNAIL